MTSNPPAQPRPPPPLSLSNERARQRSFSSLPSSRRASISSLSSQYGTEGVPTGSAIDGPPAKRRKVESQGASPAGVPFSLEGALETSKKSIQQRKLVSAPWALATSARRNNTVTGEAKSKSVLPLPKIPCAELPNEPPLSRIRTSCRYRLDVPVPNTPDSIRCPSSAPELEQKRPADYFPWTGNHTEDLINETNVKSGYWDRAPQPAERESNTAKAPLYNAFKHRQGLDSLSALFTLVLEQKSRHGNLSSTSTFRPPPRVTLTEVKRKQWVADLADGSVPLRRLSRTIPQGIRGLQLLEQCLSNEVPVNRAIWFVKCVGANEIRALKRKGATAAVTAGAENKWLKDWTMNIGQFLESSIGQCGKDKWSDNLRYCLQLCVRLYQESLMDKDHFLDWLVRNFTGCKLESIASWLPLVQLFRHDLTRFRKRARQLAGSFLAHLRYFAERSLKENLLTERLKNSVRGLISIRPACFLLGDTWNLYRDTLRSCLNMDDVREARIFEYIDIRNERLLGKMQSVDEEPSYDRDVFAMLDTASAPFNVHQLSDRLLELKASSNKLVSLCLQWATTRFRGNPYRIYLVARLVRKWQKAGKNIDGAILEYFSLNTDVTLLNIDAFRHLFAELSRTKTFSTSRFLETLSVQGARNSVDGSGDASVCTLLLKDLCLGDNDTGQANLRINLLRRQQSSTTDSMNVLHQVKTELEETLLAGETSGDIIQLSQACRTSLRRLDWATRFELSTWLRARSVELSKRTMVEVIGKPPLPGSRPFTLAHFSTIRDVLEILDDVAILADVLQILSGTKQEPILAAMTDTLHCNALSLSAIGAFEPLQRILCQAYVALRTVRPCILLFATSLMDLCQSYPNPITPLRALQQDLVRGDRGRLLSACSPFSDGVAESLQQAGTTFIDDFEAILQGEPNMSEQTMTSLFTVLVGRIMKPDVEPANPSLFTLCQLLARLRLFKTTQGDSLIQKWLGQSFATGWSSLHESVLVELLYTRCITLEMILDLPQQSKTAMKNEEAVKKLVVEAFLPQSTDTENSQRSYVLRIGGKKLMATNAEKVLRLVLTTSSSETTSLDVCTWQLPNLLTRNTFMSSLPVKAVERLDAIVNTILGESSNERSPIEYILMRANHLSLPFCQFRLDRMTKSLEQATDASQLETHARSAFDGLQLGLGADDLEADLRKILVAALPTQLQDRVRLMAEQQFFGTLPKFFQGKSGSSLLQLNASDRLRSQKAADAVVSLGCAPSRPVPGDGTGLLIEKLTVIAKALGSKNDLTIATPTSPNVASSPISPAFHALQTALPPAQHSDNRYKDHVLSVLEYLNMLLRITSMKTSLFSLKGGASMPKATQNEQIKLVSLLASIATQPPLAHLLQLSIDDVSKTKIRESVSFTLDVAARLADDLTEDARALCIKILKDRLRDERILWLIGNMTVQAQLTNPGGHGVAMLHESKGFMGEFRPKQWEMLESGGGKENDTCLGLGLFGAKKVSI